MKEYVEEVKDLHQIAKDMSLENKERMELKYKQKMEFAKLRELFSHAGTIVRRRSKIVESYQTYSKPEFIGKYFDRIIERSALFLDKYRDHARQMRKKIEDQKQK